MPSHSGLPALAKQRRILLKLTVQASHKKKSCMADFPLPAMVFPFSPAVGFRWSYNMWFSPPPLMRGRPSRSLMTNENLLCRRRGRQTACRNPKEVSCLTLNARSFFDRKLMEMERRVRTVLSPHIAIPVADYPVCPSVPGARQDRWFRALTRSPGCAAPVSSGDEGSWRSRVTAYTASIRSGGRP